MHEGCDYDCEHLTLDLVPAFLRNDDLSDWILTLQTEDPKAYSHALSDGARPNPARGWPWP